MGFVVLILVGAAAGWLASRFVGVRLTTAETVGLGILGTLVGTLTLRLLLQALGMLTWLLGAFIGVLVVLWAYETFVKSR